MTVEALKEQLMMFEGSWISGSYNYQKQGVVMWMGFRCVHLSLSLPQRP